MAANGSLRTPQRRAIEALLTTDTIEDAADVAGVGERTLYRWLSEDALFRQRVREAQDKALQAAVTRLSGEALAAVRTLAEVHKAEDTPASVRVQAARAILKTLMNMKEQFDIVDRIEEIERRLSM